MSGRREKKRERDRMIGRERKRSGGRERASFILFLNFCIKTSFFNVFNF